MRQQAYHQLGMTAQMRGRLEEADRWCRKALTIVEELGDQSGMASTYHQLGIAAQMRGRLEEADRWYRKALTIEQEVGDRLGMASAYGQLGLLAETRGDGRAALEWTVRCMALFDEFPHPATRPGPDHLRRLTHVLGEPVLEATWQRVTGHDLPAEVRRHVRTTD